MGDILRNHIECTCEEFVAEVAGKRVQELMSGWLNAYDFAALLDPYLLVRSATDVTDESTLAVDFPDISKEFGGDGMEGMEMGYDGSRHCTAIGA